MFSNSSSLPRRYPGLKPFERSQSGVFHGRGEDITRLASLVLRERLVVLFAKSGIGKTSLLQAGVAPELERQEYASVFLRMDKTDAPLLDTISSVLSQHPMVSGKDDFNQQSDMPPTLWERVKRLEFDLNGLPATPVLVFDQFEEVFTLSHSDKSRQDFLMQLADLANETMPEAIRTRLLAQHQRGEISFETMQWWERQPELRIILSIRSDFLHLLDQMSTQIPGILRNRYYLQPLSREKSRMAIIQPAIAEGQYASPPFQYAEAALHEMVDFLAGDTTDDAAGKDADDMQTPKKRDEIETVNLQIICQDVEEKIIDWQKGEGFVVTPDFYGNIDGLRLSIRNFYHNQLESFPRVYAERLDQKVQHGGVISEMDQSLRTQAPAHLRLTAQKLIEESLVTSGNRRNSVVDDTLLDGYKITKDFLDTLVDRSRLLRKEPRLDDFYYEISHDTLLPAIIESRNKRREEESANKEKNELQRKLAEEARRRESVEEELKAEAQKRKLARIVSITLLGMLVLMLLFAAWVIYDYQKSVREELRDAEESVHNEFFDAALPTYEKMWANPRRRWVLTNVFGKDIQRDMGYVTLLQGRHRNIMDSLDQGDMLFFVKKDYAMALRAYHHALDTNGVYRALNLELSAKDTSRSDYLVDTNLVEDSRIVLTRRVESTRQFMITQFKVAQRDFETFSEARLWNLALRNLQKMETLLPDHADDLKALQKELNLNESPQQYVARELERCRQALAARGIK